MVKESVVGDLAEGVLNGARASLGRAITLVESRTASDEEAAQQLLQRLMPKTGGSIRLGITGIPGAGKSTLIDELGSTLTAKGHKVAVLAVDPTSQRTGGSILGDKTRMNRLANDPNAFIRPSPAGTSLGGVARRTRETMLVCEAAGFDVVIVETVGIGQSEMAVAGMVDTFLLLSVAGTGDELQGIKKGVIELADIVAVNKADGEGQAPARRAAADLRAALNILQPASAVWLPQVLTVSGRTGENLDTLWELVENHRGALAASGEFETHRQQQQVEWMWAMLNERVMLAVRRIPAVADALAGIEREVREGRLPATLAVMKLVAAAGLDG